MKTETITLLSQKFLKADKELQFGINRKFLVSLFSKIGHFKKKEQIREFYFNTVYGKKVINVIDL